MRHDPASGAIIVMLRSLKMHGMAQAIIDLMEQGSPAFEAAIPVLSQLLKAETCQWAPKFPQMWALKIPYVGGLVSAVINRNQDRDSFLWRPPAAPSRWRIERHAIEDILRNERCMLAHSVAGTFDLDHHRVV